MNDNQMIFWHSIGIEYTLYPGNINVHTIKTHQYDDETKPNNLRTYFTNYSLYSISRSGPQIIFILILPTDVAYIDTNIMCKFQNRSYPIGQYMSNKVFMANISHPPEYPLI